MRSFLLFSLLIIPATQLVAKPAVIPLDKIIAIVDDNIITKLELDKRVKLISQQLKQQGNVSLPSQDTLRKQVLERLILEKLQLEMAKRTGIKITDEMLNRVMANIAKENRLSMQQFRKVLEKDGYQYSDFRENIRQQVTISRLRKMRVENKVNVSEQEINNYLKQNPQDKGQATADEYHLSQILIATPEAATPKQIKKAKMKAQKIFAKLQKGANFSQTAIAVSNDGGALKGGDLGWRKSPTRFNSVVTKMQINDIKGPLRSSNGFHIIKLKNKRSSSIKHIVNQTKARHILIRPTQVLSREEARMRLVRILQRIKNGADFASLARASSDDKAAAAEGGSLGWVAPGTMVPAFEEEMNKLKPGEISKPFMTQFGWHIVQLISRRKHDNTQRFQRSRAIQHIRKRKTEEAVQDWLRRIRAEAYVDYRSNK